MAVLARPQHAGPSNWLSRYFRRRYDGSSLFRPAGRLDISGVPVSIVEVISYRVALFWGRVGEGARVRPTAPPER